MAQTVASHAIAAFTDPQNGQSPIDAAQVLANDNALRVGYVAHDADTGIHLQSSALASRPAFGTAGRKWLSADASSYRIFFDTGSAWQEVTYLRSDAGGTVAGNITVSSGGITVTGNSTITGTLGGVTTLTATTLGGTLSTAAQPNVTSVGTLTSLTVSGALSVEGNTTLGNATSDTITATGRFASNIEPSTDSTRNIGGVDLYFLNAYTRTVTLETGTTLSGGLVSGCVGTESGYAVGVTKVVGTQEAAVDNATGAGDVVAQLNALLARLRTHGLIAT